MPREGLHCAEDFQDFHNFEVDMLFYEVFHFFIIVGNLLEFVWNVLSFY